MTKRLQSKYMKDVLLSFDRAIGGKNARATIVTLELIGRAFFNADFDLPDELIKKLTAHAELVGWAAMLIGMHAEMEGSRLLTKLLYARTGYQILVDMDLWQGHPGEISHLEESDEELLEVVSEYGVPNFDIPDAVPDSHVWWPTKTD